ncbi:MAG: XdhC family protein [Chitinophagaceae bacterium]
MELFNFIIQQLNHKYAVYFLCVVESNGSSPGRQGFKMAVSQNGEIFGTIGGGIMEFKLVEKAKHLLNKQQYVVELQTQYHDKIHPKNQSGMICSGMQTVAFIPLNTSAHLQTVQSIIQNKTTAIQLSKNGLQQSVINDFVFKNETESWLYNEPLFFKPTIHIIGAGHCALALSQQMNWLGFYIKLYDDREALNTWDANHFAHEKIKIDYETIASNITISNNDVVVIMTVGYRTDKLVLQQIISKPCSYLGLLGSEQKIKTLFEELLNEGFARSQLNQVHAPVGININSKTTAEIAVSIAAQIIQIKNKN